MVKCSNEAPGTGDGCGHLQGMIFPLSDEQISKVEV